MLSPSSSRPAIDERFLILSFGVEMLPKPKTKDDRFWPVAAIG